MQRIRIEQYDNGVWTTYCAACLRSTLHRSRMAADAAVAAHAALKHATERAYSELVDRRVQCRLDFHGAIVEDD